MSPLVSHPQMGLKQTHSNKQLGLCERKAELEISLPSSVLVLLLLNLVPQVNRLDLNSKILLIHLANLRRKVLSKGFKISRIPLCIKKERREAHERLICVFKLHQGEDATTSCKQRLLYPELGGVFTLKVRPKNDAEGIFWWTTCFRFTPEWLWQDLR